MSDVETKQKFDRIVGKWPSRPGQSGPPQPLPDVQDQTVIQEQEPVNPQQRDESSPDMKMKPSEREDKIIEEVASRIDFGDLLINDCIEVDVPIRPDLTVRFRSPRGDALFLYRDYLNRITKKEKAEGYEISPADEYNFRVFWQLAMQLVAINGQPFMMHVPEDSKVDPLSLRIERLKEKSRHVIEQLAWGRNLFEVALTKVCNGGPEFEEALKNS